MSSTADHFTYESEDDAHVPYTMHRYLEHEEHFPVAAQITQLMDSLVAKAMKYTTDRLGFNPWTRSLSDYEPDYGFTIPEELYHADDVPKAVRFKEHLLNYIKGIFRMHYLYVNAEWRESGEYEVDAFGSRNRTVNVGTHIFMTFSMRSPHTRRPPLDPVPPHLIWKNGIPYKWDAVEDAPDCYTINYSTMMYVD